MDEVPVIGPFTMKQFIFLTGGFGLAYITYRGLPPTYSLPLVVAFLYVTFRLVKQVAPPRIDEAYISAKRYQVGSVEEYRTWLNQRIAITTSQIDERARKGFVQDPELDKMVHMLEAARDKSA